jgi:GAF domain-containing protein
MKRRSRVGREPIKERRRKAPRPKQPSELKSHARSPSNGQDTELARVTRDLNEAMEQQSATSEVLSVISTTRGQLEPVFSAILRNAARICQAKFGTLNLYDGKHFRTVALHNAPPKFTIRLGEILRPHPEGGLAYVVRTKQVAHIHDLRASPGYVKGDKAVIEFAHLAGTRTVLIVPMIDSGKLTGTISIYRQEVRPFAEKQIELIKYFAAQAVIAVENARLLSELRQSLQQQTATSEVLQVISRSPGDLQPVFGAMLEKAVRVCDGMFGEIYSWENDALVLVAMHNTPPAFAEGRELSPYRPPQTTPIGRMLATKSVVHVEDLAAEGAYIEQHAPGVVAAVKLGGIRTLLAVPMLKKNELVGALFLSRQEVRPFTDKQIELVKNFAAQADRECAAAQRIEAIAGAANGDLGSAPGHLKLSWRFAGCLREPAEKRHAALQS